LSSIAWGNRRPISLLVIVIVTSIALRKAVTNQTTRIAIGMVEVVLIASAARPSHLAPRQEDG
jgi:hypothetical protein